MQHTCDLIWAFIFFYLRARCILLDYEPLNPLLTHWGQVTHICVSEPTSIVPDNGLSPGRRQAIIWNNAGILLIGHSGTNVSEIVIEILTFSFKKMSLKVSSAKWRPFCLGLNVFNGHLVPYILTLSTSRTWPTICPRRNQLWGSRDLLSRSGTPST